jgi:hypothetical protein
MFHKPLKLVNLLDSSGSVVSRYLRFQKSKTDDNDFISPAKSLTVLSKLRLGTHTHTVTFYPETIAVRN